MLHAPDLRPRTVGELLDGAFFLYRRTFFRLLAAATLLSVPTLLLAAAFAEASGRVMTGYTYAVTDWFEAQRASGFRPTHAGHEAAARVQELYGPVLLYGLLSTLLQSISRGGACAAMALAAWAAVQRSRPAGALALVRKALPRVVPASLAILLPNFVWITLSLCLPIPILVSVLLAAAPAIAVLEQGPLERRFRALRLPGAARAVLRATLLPLLVTVDCCVRSVALTWSAAAIGRGTLFTFFLLTFVTTFAAAVAFGGMLAVGSPGAMFWLQHYAEVLFLPVLGVATALWYLDLRVRREGLDLIAPEAGAAPA